MNPLVSIWHAVKTFFGGWQAHDYVTTVLALAAFVLSVRREMKDRKALQVRLSLVRTGFSIKDLAVINIGVAVVNSGAKPLSIEEVNVEVWDSEHRQFFTLQESDTRLLSPAQTAEYVLKLGDRSLIDEEVLGRKPLNFLVTGAGIYDSEGRAWKVKLTDIARFTALTARSYPAFDLTSLNLSPRKRAWLLLRLQFYAFRVFFLRAFLRSHKSTRFVAHTE